jgi:hypothetical protein
MHSPSGTVAVPQDTGKASRPLTEWVTQGVLLLVAAYVAFSSRGLGIWMPEGPGPGFFPLVLALGLAALSGAWFIQTLRHTHAAHGEQDKAPLLSSDAVITLASLIVVAAVMNFLGFQAVMALFLLFHLRYRGRRRWLTSIVIALAGSVGIFHLFNDLMLVPLPYATVPPLTWLGV